MKHARRQVTTHVYVDDNTRDHRGEGRCAYTPGYGEPCGMPRINRHHQMPDTTVAQAAHRARTGER